MSKEITLHCSTQEFPHLKTLLSVSSSILDLKVDC